MSTFELQPTLTGTKLELRPLTPDDFTATFKAASDPLIWELHPQSTRYQEDVFRTYFDGALKSGGAFAILDKETQAIIGSSRYYDYQPDKSQIIIGYTFLTRPYWGGSFNRELKSLMLHHAFRFVNTVLFEVGTNNLRSRRAMEKIGGTLIGEALLDNKSHVIYSITKQTLQL